MNIVICCNRFPALSQPFVTSQILGLERRGHRVTVIAESIDERLLSELPGGGLSGPVLDLDMKGTPPLSSLISRLHLLGGALIGMPGFLRRTAHAGCYLRPRLRWRGAMASRAYARAAAIGKVDLVHAHMGETALWARSIAIRRRVPFAVTFHGSDATRDPREFGWSTYRRLLDPGTTTFIAHSPFVADRLRSGLGVTPLRVPLGIDTNLFAPGDRPRGGSGEPRRMRLAFVGRLIPMKGVRLAIETLAILRKGASGMEMDATLEIVGEGPESSNINRLAKVLGVTSCVRLRGPKTPAGVAAILREVDILLVPSLSDVDGRQEAYGLVCLEAHASGVPVVGTCCGGLPGAIGAPQGGRCVPQHSPLAMASAVRELVGLSNGRGFRASLRNRILTTHSEAASLDAYERAFAAATSRGGGSVEPAAADVPDDWGDPGHSVPAAPRAQGSLAAYVIGKEVVQLNRKRTAEMPGGRDLAGSWTTVDRIGSGTIAESMHGRADVVLDLDGVWLEALRSDAHSLSRMIRPGGIAIIAVQSGEAAPGRIEQLMTESGFSEILLLDRLFVPGPHGLEPTCDAGQQGVAPFQRPALRYVLCVRSRLAGNRSQ